MYEYLLFSRFRWNRAEESIYNKTCHQKSFERELTLSLEHRPVLSSRIAKRFQKMNDTRIIQAIRPTQCFFENVRGHISLGLNTVISDMEEDGYRTTWGIFSANEVGAPHRRKRVFILGNTNNTHGERGRLNTLREKHADTDSASNSIRKQAAQQWL